MGEQGADRRLTAATIVEAGIHVAAQGDALTVRRVGSELGVDPTAIYRHFRNREEFARAVIDRVMGLALDELTCPVEQWRDFLRELCESTVSVFARFPRLSDEASRASTQGPEERKTVELILRAFRTSGLSGEQLVRHYGVYSGLVLTFATGAARADGDAPWVPSGGRLEAEQFPELYSVRDELDRLTARAIRMQSVEMVIESAARHATER